MKIKPIKTNQELNKYIDDHPDECLLGAKCTDCPYEKCYLDYPNGREGLADDKRASYLYNEFRNGASVTILAKVVNMEIESVKRAIARYYRRKNENRSSTMG